MNARSTNNASSTARALVERARRSMMSHAQLTRREVNGVVVRLDKAGRRTAVEVREGDETVGGGALLAVEVVAKEEVDALRNALCEQLAEVVNEVRTYDGRF